MDETYDVVVVGGGASGLSGALALARARRSVLVVDAGEPRNAPAGHVHNYLAREGMPPADLLSAGRDEVLAGEPTGLVVRMTLVLPEASQPTTQEGESPAKADASPKLAAL